MRAIPAEREIKLDLKYQKVLKKKNRTEYENLFIEVWEGYRVLKYHVGNP